MRVPFWSRLAGVLAVLALAAGAWAQQEKPFRPPAVPLVTCDPYFSIWSPADRLTDAGTMHWTGAPNTLTGLVRIDGKAYRIMGKEPADTPALEQVGLELLPTRTIYTFRNAQAQLTLTFTTPMLPDNLEVLSRPVTYVTWDAKALDGQTHKVAVYLEASSELVVDNPDKAEDPAPATPGKPQRPVKPEQPVTWARATVPGLTALRIGSVEQPILAKRGDNLRIDWGYAYLATPDQAAAVITGAAQARGAFLKGEAFSADDAATPRLVHDDAKNGTHPHMPVMALALDLGSVAAEPVSRVALLAYDDLYSIQYFQARLRPYWRRNGASAEDLLAAAAKDYPKLAATCAKFDAEVVADLREAGGEAYVRLGCLAYRQAIAGNKVAADANGQPLLFPKECFSNGCIATVDVIYPMAPEFVLFSPALAKASVANIMEYASSPRWKFPFAPHDLGTYPKATGQVYGGGERTIDNQMPVEESGNMLIILASIARIEGNAKFAEKYWPAVTKWAEFLKEKGLDPENQLCTDDFAGHLAHNVNLSAKAIVGLAAYADLCKALGKDQDAAAYRKIAEEFAAKWVKMADDGDHFRLAFDKPGTWSQKYNLVWDRVLGLKLFPETVVEKEMAFYKKEQKKYGLPLDNRKAYTKADWITWTASLTGKKEDFETLLGPMVKGFDESNSRAPMTDWYDTNTAGMVGFRARPVVGGVFIRLLENPTVWKKYADRAEKVGNTWAPLPLTNPGKALVPTSAEKPLAWRYTTSAPADGWFKPDFDASTWKESPAGFGAGDPPGAAVRTPWTTADIWARREFDLPPSVPTGVQVEVYHDEDCEIYLNGILAARLTGYSIDYERADLTEAAKAALKPGGKNLLAVHCHQTQGGQFIDVGLVVPQAGKWR